MWAAIILSGVLTQTALDQARDDLRSTNGISVLGALLDISNELELSGSTLRIDDSIGSRVTTTSLPFRTLLGEPSELGLSPVLEGGAAYSKIHGSTDDLFRGLLPGAGLGIDTTWRTYGAQVGGGADLDLGGGLHFSATAMLGLFHVENKNFYSGPGAPALAPLFDDILFNWKATVLSYGGSLRAEESWTLGESLRLESVLRYDGRAYETLRSTDSAQEDTDPTHILTLRLQPTGPLGISIADRTLGWKGIVAFRRYFGAGADQLDFRGYIEVGGELLIGLPGDLPMISGLRLGGAWIWGPDVKGWTAGVSASF